MKSRSSHENARENNMIQKKEETERIREKIMGLSLIQRLETVPIL